MRWCRNQLEIGPMEANQSNREPAKHLEDAALHLTPEFILKAEQSLRSLVERQRPLLDALAARNSHHLPAAAAAESHQDINALWQMTEEIEALAEDLGCSGRTHEAPEEVHQADEQNSSRWTAVEDPLL